MKKLFLYIFGIILFSLITYVSIGYYIAYSILRIEANCGLHKGSLPNSWDTKIDHHTYSVLERKILREYFPSSQYHLNEWQDVYFPSRNNNIKLNGWLFNYYKNRPIVIVVHGIFPNGKCKPESNLIASLLVKNNINALTIDLRNYGQSETVSSYENLGLSEYKDVLGAFDFLKKIGFESNKIGLHGISLGASTAIIAASKEKNINAIWSDSSLAEFNLILKDEISRYGMPNIFGPIVSLIGKILTGINPSELSPVNKLSSMQYYFFTHGEKDKRIPVHHFQYIKDFSILNNINAEFWLVKDSYHVDAMFKYPEEYGVRMRKFFDKHLK